MIFDALGTDGISYKGPDILRHAECMVSVEDGYAPLSLSGFLCSSEIDELFGNPEESMLSQRGRYALKAMLNLARVPERTPKQVSAIATEENIPRKFLEAIMSELRHEGLVEASRGKFGGYRLQRPPEAIMFGEIMRVTDGPIAMIPCVSENFYKRCEDCIDDTTCALRRVMGEVRRKASDILDRTSLADARSFPIDDPTQGLPVIDR